MVVSCCESWTPILARGIVCSFPWRWLRNAGGTVPSAVTTAAWPTVVSNGSGFAGCRCKAGACDCDESPEPELATATEHSMGKPNAAVTELMTAMGHEQVVLEPAPPSGLRAIIAVHSTALGPSLGGIRFWRYPSEHDALVDALRLSQAMSLKASAAGLHQGGGKAVVLWDSPDAPRSEALLRAMGRAIDDLGGRYIAAEDVGATPRDMQVIAAETPWVTGTEGPGGSGDPSPMTAYGLLKAMETVLEELDGDPALAGKRVVVDGVGHVGSHLARLATEAGPRGAVPDGEARRGRAP